MKKIIVGMFLLFTCSGLFAQKNSISGMVADENGAAIVGASITIKDSYLGTFSKSDGTFIFDHISKGTYIIQCSFIGYESVEKEITVPGTSSISIKMDKKAISIQPITITAIKAGESTPVAKTTITKSAIEDLNIAKDIPYQLEQTPSVVATSENGTGMGYTGMRIRGTDISRINVTVNGIPLNDAESQGVYWVDMADFGSSIDEIQIQRGVGTSTNGAASFGASVNFQTVAVEDNPFTRVSSTVGSFGTFKENISAGSGIIDSCFGISARYSKVNSSGWVERGFSDHQSFHITSSYFKGKNTLNANVLLGEEHTGITWWGVPSDIYETNPQYNPSGKYTDSKGNTKYYNETDNYWQNHYMLNFSHEFSQYVTFTTSIHATTGKGYYEEYKARVDDWGSENTFAKYGMDSIKLSDTVLVIDNVPFTFADSTIYSSDMRREKWMQNIFYGGNASLNYNKNKLEFHIGTGYTVYEGNHFGNVTWVKFMPNMANDFEWYRNKSNKTDFNIFAKAQYQITSKISMYGDIQMRQINYTMKGIDDDLLNLDETYNWNFINPKAGIFYTINKENSLFLSGAIANREPSRTDLKDASKDGITPKHETLYDIELGYQYTVQKMGFGINVYNMQYNNQLVLTGKLNDVGSALMENVKNSYRRGIEFAIGTRPAKEFAWNANLTLSENKIIDYTEYAAGYDADWNDIQVVNHLGTTDISYSPNVIASNSFMFYPEKTVSFGFISKYVGAQYFDNTSDETRKLKAYTVHNFQLNYGIPFEKSKLEIQILVNNILDKKYISNGYGGNWFEQGNEQSWMYYFPQAGINYMCKAVFDF